MVHTQTTNHYKHHEHKIQHNTYSSETSQAEPTSDPGNPKTFDKSLQQRVRLHEKSTILSTTSTTNTTILLPWQQQQQHLQQSLQLLLLTILPKPTPRHSTTTTTTTVGTDCRLLPASPVLLAAGQKTNQCLLLLNN